MKVLIKSNDFIITMKDKIKMQNVCFEMLNEK